MKKTKERQPLLIWKVGSDQFPADKKDIKKVRKLIKKVKGFRDTLVVNHVNNIEVLY
jgi:hypothetical protein